MISVPTLLLDEIRCRKNIKKMVNKARVNNAVLRPHFKTHVSREIGNWFREEGVESITVSSLLMAQYFAQDYWNDILVAFPVNIREINTINELAGKINLALLVESAYSVNFLKDNLLSEIGVYIKIDSGYHRTGVAFDDFNTIASILKQIDGSSHMKFIGFLTHAGNSYSCRGVEDIQAVHGDSIKCMQAVAGHFKRDYPDLKISVGDTPTCSTMDDFSMVDEMRPGNFVFFDLTQYYIGSCSFDEIAVAMACPVVAVHEERSEIVIYGGSIHFSKESVNDPSGRTVYGQVAEKAGYGWGDPVTGAYINRMSQEHGIISAPKEVIKKYKPGDIIIVIPVHSCLTANLMREYFTTGGRKISRL